MAGGGSTVVEQSTHNPKFGGSYPTADTGREKKGKKWIIDVPYNSMVKTVKDGGKQAQNS